MEKGGEVDLRQQEHLYKKALEGLEAEILLEKAIGKDEMV
jgi:hypothetical protein